MLRRPPLFDEASPSAGPTGTAGDIARLDDAIVRAERRLRMAARLGDLAMTLVEAVHRRAVAEEAAAFAALAVPTDDPPPTPAREPPGLSQTATSGGRTEAAPRTGSRPGARASALGGGALFARLTDSVRQCLELETRLDEILRRLEISRDLLMTWQERRRGESEEARDDAARRRIADLVQGAIDEAAATRQEARELHAALWERLQEDEAYSDIARQPDVVRAASLCRDLGLDPDRSRWPPPTPDPPPPVSRPKSSPFNQVSRKPILVGSLGKYSSAPPPVADDPADRWR